MSSYTIPSVIESTPKGERVSDIFSRLLSERIVFVGLTRPLREPRAFGERLLADSPATLAAVAKNPAEFVGSGGSVPDPCFGDGAVQELRFRHG